MLGSARSVLLQSALPAPMAAYSFSEGSGLTTVDSSTHGRTLTLNATTWTTGHTGFGITNTTTGQGATGSFIGPADTLTIMAWIRPLNLAAGTTHFALGFVDSSANTQVGIFTQRADFGTSDVLQADIRIGGSLKELHGTALTLNTWTHIALTYNGSIIYLYKDGVLVTSLAATGNIGTGDAFYVAGWSTVAPYDTDVDIDDVRVFSTALTQGQVIIGMNTPVT
ncbi:MAG TPA: LamG domain-containing protein [Candidatus Saccharimonadales bacterium]|nr:LamG domain-containing protein [Candidatus Saccharimonadales bacterium]